MLNNSVQEWFKDPDFQKLSTIDKQRALSGFFDDKMAGKFADLPENELSAVRNDFVETNLGPHKPKPPSRGVIADLGVAVARGGVGAGETIMRGLATMDKAVGVDDGISRRIAEDIASFRDDTMPISKEASQPGLRHSLTQGVESVTQSLAARAPFMAVGGAGGMAGVAAGYMAGGPLYGAAQYDQAYDDYVKKGVPKEDAHNAAVLEAVSEAGWEVFSDAIEIMTLRGGGILTKPLRDAAKNGTKRLIQSTYGEAAKKAGSVAFAEGSTELANVATQAEIKRAYSPGEETAWEAIKSNFGPIAVSSLIFGALGGGFHKVHTARIKNLITDKEAEPEERLGAVQEVYREIARTDPALADRWRTGATLAVMRGESISDEIDEGTVVEAPAAPAGSAGEDTTVTAKETAEQGKRKKTAAEILTGRPAAPMRQASVAPEEEIAEDGQADKYPLVDNQGRRYRKFVSGGLVQDDEKIDPLGRGRVYPVAPEEAVSQDARSARTSPRAVEMITGRQAPVRRPSQAPAALEAQGEAVAVEDISQGAFPETEQQAGPRASAASILTGRTAPVRSIGKRTSARPWEEELSDEPILSDLERAIGPRPVPEQKPVRRVAHWRMDEEDEAYFAEWLDRVVPKDQQKAVEANIRRYMSENPQDMGRPWHEIKNLAEGKPAEADTKDEGNVAAVAGGYAPRPRAGQSPTDKAAQESKPAAAATKGEGGSPKAEGKEPWEMTRRQYVDSVSEGRAVDDRAYKRHKNLVAMALNVGKAVPDEVLAEYPDLIEKPQTNAAQTITGKPASPTEAKDMADWAGKMMSRGAARIGGVDYSVQQAPTGSFYYRRTKDGVRTEKGPGYPAKWSRKEAVIEAAKEARQDFERWQREQEKEKPVEGAAADKAVEAGPAEKPGGLKVEYIGPLNWTVVDADGNWLARFETKSEGEKYIEQVSKAAPASARSARTSPSAVETITGKRPAKVSEASAEDILGEIDRQVAERTAPKERMAESAEKIKAGMARIAELARQANAVFDETGQLSEGEIDEGRWNKLKPIFDAMWQEAKALNMNIKEFVSAVLDQLGTQASGYFKKWVRDEFGGKAEGETKQPAAPEFKFKYGDVVRVTPESGLNVGFGGRVVDDYFRDGREYVSIEGKGEMPADSFEIAPPEVAPPPKPATPLSEISVNIKAYSESGAAMMVKEKADVALAENAEQLSISRKILECLNI